MHPLPGLQRNYGVETELIMPTRPWPAACPPEHLETIGEARPKQEYIRLFSPQLSHLEPSH